MQVLVRDDLADALIQTASSTLRNAATSNANQDASSDGVAPMTNGTSATRSSFPSTWSPGSSIQLMQPKLSDTTDRSLFRRARLAVFDPYGYRHQRGLRRPLFYKSGYLSCTKCNGMTFIDASALRTILELKSLVDFGKVRPENLPPCVGCGETAGLRVGAHDFLSLIEGESYICTATTGSVALQFKISNHSCVDCLYATIRVRAHIFAVHFDTSIAAVPFGDGVIKARPYKPFDANIR